ncbi:MAG: glycoside hydrolase family 3 [Clostridia bacterium]|nr:glycoside hydrolase family 3 [Clostridia bacterium]
MTEEMRIKIGQRLVVGFDGLEVPPEYVELVKQYKVGNALLFRRNVKSYEQLKALCASLRDLIVRETGIEPFIMIDEECGSVSRLAGIATETPSAMAIGETGYKENAYRIGKLIGEELRAVGINFNLAPVMDCLTNPAAPNGNRCFSSKPEKVADYGVAYTQGLQETGVFACAKHFFGLGDSSVDSHLGLPILNKTAEEIENCELVSFRVAIKGGVKGVMSAHLVCPTFEPERIPGTVSRKIMTGLLREKLGFDGISLTDGMEMNAVMDLYGVEEGTRLALAAGVDMALICHSEEQASSASEYIYKAIENGQMDMGEIEAHFSHIVNMKKALPLHEGNEIQFGGAAQKALAESIMREAVKVVYAPEGKPLPSVDKHTVFMGVPAKAGSFASDDIPLDAAAVCAKTFGSKQIGLKEAPPAGTKTAVVFLNKHPDNEYAIAAIRCLSEQNIQTIAVNMNVPFCSEGLPKTVWQIGAWQYDQLALNAVIDFLRK